MNENDLRVLLTQVQQGSLEIDKAVSRLRDLPFKELGAATIDNHRELRRGYPEVIFCSGKTVTQIQEITKYMLSHNTDILMTRADDEVFAAVAKLFAKARYNPLGRTISIKRSRTPPTDTYIAIVTGGTSDGPVAEEAAETALLFGNRVERIQDVGVAGIHRLLAKLEIIRGARVIIVIAGMEGALASVVAGLVDKPVIAVPTSVGYGASFGGLSALLSMLTACAGGICAVNIDNGFGAAYLASMINKL